MFIVSKSDSKYVFESRVLQEVKQKKPPWGGIAHYRPKVWFLWPLPQFFLNADLTFPYGRTDNIHRQFRFWQVIWMLRNQIKK